MTDSPDPLDPDYRRMLLATDPEKTRSFLLGNWTPHTWRPPAMTYEGAPRVCGYCTATPDAPCHWYPDTEEWQEDGLQPSTHHDECWIAAWMDNGCAETCGPENEPVQGHAPINVEYNGCVVWWYADPAPDCDCPTLHEADGTTTRLNSPTCPYPQHHPRTTP